MNQPPPCPGVHRRTFLADVGLGFTGLALGAMLQRDGAARAEAPGAHVSGSPWAPPDRKPALNKYADKTYDETPHANPFKSPLFRQRSRDVVGGDRLHSKIFPLQVGFRKHGDVGLEVCDWLPHLAT